MRNIGIVIDKNGNIVVDSQKLGYGGEHNASVLNITFDTEGYARYSVLDYFRIVIDGKYSEDLYFDQQRIIYTVPEVCMQPPEVQCQVLGYKLQNGEPSVIMKSACFKLLVDRSEVADIEAENQPNLFEKALAVCTESALSASESLDGVTKAVENAYNVISVVDVNTRICKQMAEYASASANEAEKSASVLAKAVLDYNNISNVLKGKASGLQAVNIPDVSPLGHKVDISVESKNLFNPENVLSGYVNAQHEVYIGNQNYADVYAFVYAECKPNEIYTVSKIAGERFSVQFTDVLPQQGVKVFGLVNNHKGSKITVTAPENAKYITAFVFNSIVEKNITRGEMLDSIQIEKGNAVTEYTPYVAVEEGMVTLLENRLCQAFEEFALYEEFECERVKNLNIKVNTKGRVAIKPKVVNTSTLVGTSVKIYPDSGFADIYFTVNGDTVAWSGTVSALDSAGNVTSTESVSGSYTVQGLTEENSYFDGWLVEDYNYDPEIFSECRLTAMVDTGKIPVEVSISTQKADGVNELKAVYHPDVNGKLNVPSIYPNMTVSVDKEGVIIDADYNIDLNKAYLRLCNAIASLGGTV